MVYMNTRNLSCSEQERPFNINGIIHSSRHCILSNFSFERNSWEMKSLQIFRWICFIPDFNFLFFGICPQSIFINQILLVQELVLEKFRSFSNSLELTSHLILKERHKADTYQTSHESFCQLIFKAWFYKASCDFWAFVRVVLSRNLDNVQIWNSIQWTFFRSEILRNSLDLEINLRILGTTGIQVC